MKRVVLIAALLASCGPSDEARRPKVFSPIPNAEASAFACEISSAEGIVLGMDPDDPEEQAFTHFGGETLRLIAVDPMDRVGDGPGALFRVYDYPNFQVKLMLDADLAGSVQMLRRNGDEFLSMGEPVAVTGQCDR